MQKGDELNESFPKDTVLRVYDLADYEYRVQPEDILSIRFSSLTKEEFDIFSQTNAQNTTTNIGAISLSGYLVDKEGMIQFPEIGKVKVGGRTVHEIKDFLQELAADYLTQPVVNVRLLNFRVTLLGEVNSQGTINTYNNNMTMMEAIGLANGLTDLADRKNVKVIRQISGNNEVLYVNLLDEQYLQNSSFFVHQNDIIIVPPLKQRPFRKYFGQNVALFLSSASTLLLIINLITN
ncbi:hypothetical protein GCM10009122_55950 [Fulvivirga kasyanovii]